MNLNEYQRFGDHISSNFIHRVKRPEATGTEVKNGWMFLVMLWIVTPELLNLHGRFGETFLPSSSLEQSSRSYL
jgi:hypothetical protein